MTMTAFRTLSARIERRVRQLAQQGIQGPGLVEAMAGSFPDLYQIWADTTEAEYVTLCEEYPGFYEYAVMMEGVLEAERAKPNGALANAVPLDEAVKSLVVALLIDSACLESEIQVFINGSNRRHSGAEFETLLARYRQWQRDLGRLLTHLQETHASKDVLEVVEGGLGPIMQRLGVLAARAGLSPDPK